MRAVGVRHVKKQFQILPYQKKGHIELEKIDGTAVYKVGIRVFSRLTVSYKHFSWCSIFSLALWL